MIRPEDFDLHVVPGLHWQWAETIYLSFTVPKEKIHGIIYVMARPVMGVCMSTITILDRISGLWEEQAYIDSQQHLPCPESFMNFTLPNGLSIETLVPLKHHRIRYDGIDDTRFDLEYFGLHEPYDINDVDMDPTAASRAGSAYDKAWPGHYDATYRVKGNLVVRGKGYAVDCIETGDRSWGQRAERDNGSVIWWHASFGEGLTAHLFAAHDMANTDEMGLHVSGYILEDGKVFGLVASRGTHDYRKGIPMGGVVEVTDVRGRNYLFTYSTINCCQFAPYPSNTYTHSTIRANYNGVVGYGVIEMGISRAYLGRNRATIASRT
jgi:hypothetical protein